MASRTQKRNRAGFTVWIVSPNTIIREGLRSVFSRAGWRAVLCDGEGRAGPAPDVLVVDLTIQPAPVRSLNVLLDRFRDRCLLLGFDNRGHGSAGHADLIRGEIGLITGFAAESELLAAVRDALDGAPFHEPLAASSAMAAPAGLAALTGREREVFALLGRGLWNRPLARRLGISVKTVETHKENLKRKLRQRSTNELMETAIRYREQQTNEKSGGVLIYESAGSGVK